MKKIICVCIVVIKENNKYLLTKRAKDEASDGTLWQLAGGTVEFDETPEKTLIREAKEELGLDVKIIKFIPKIFTKIASNWQAIFFIYLCERLTKDQSIKLNNEATDYGWFTLPEIKNLPTLGQVYEILQEAEIYISK